MTEYYLTFKQLHVAAVVLSLSLFVLRGAWMLADSPRLQRRWVKVLPHLIDTVLLGSAVALTLIIHQYPLANDWLTAKVVGLIAYILLGTVAIKRGKTKTVRAMALVAAVLVFGYIVSAALNHSPWGYLAW